METQLTIAQIAARPVRRVEWDEVFGRIVSRIPEGHIYYGIPRGGTIVAGLAAAHGYHVTDNPEDATAFLDDRIDSGATKRKWSTNGKPFFTLFEAGEAWLEFPWSAPMQTDAEDLVRRQLELIGEDPNREGLRETPARVVRSWRELFAGYAQQPDTVLKCEFEADGYDEMIVCRDIQFYSTCEHHLQPFFGRAHVGYLPDKRIVGLSKLARLVDVFARRLQIQERMTKQIADALEAAIMPRGVAVVIEAQHFCMLCRGVQKQESSMVTSSLKGIFQQPAPRAEFFRLVAAAGSLS
jgi:GTP cyclohydrolase I